MRDTTVPKRTSTAIAHKMGELGVGIGDLAKQAGITYEHARRIARGESIPSSRLTVRISEVLALNPNELLLLGKADRLRQKFEVEIMPDAPDNDFEEFKAIWRILSDGRRRDLIGIAKLFAGLSTIRRRTVNNDLQDIP